MTFNEYLKKSWTEHGDHSQQVASTFAEGLALLEKPEQISDLARLVVHVAGEHLGDWQSGEQWLQKLMENKHYIFQD